MRNSVHLSNSHPNHTSTSLSTGLESTSTLITDMFGDPYQFFLNLPFGEIEERDSPTLKNNKKSCRQSMAEQRRSGSFNNPYKFNGKGLDSETGLYYYGARYYNPRISNWLSVDPIALWQPVQEIEHYIEGQHNGGYFNPKNMSVYGYTYQSPVNYIDPNGKQVWANGVGNYLESQFRAIGTQIDVKVQHVAYYFSAPFRALNEEFGGGVGVGFGFKYTKYYAGRIDAEVFGAKLGPNKDGADLEFSVVKLKG